MATPPPERFDLWQLCNVKPSIEYSFSFASVNHVSVNKMRSYLFTRDLSSKNLSSFNDLILCIKIRGRTVVTADFVLVISTRCRLTMLLLLGPLLFDVNSRASFEFKIARPLLEELHLDLGLSSEFKSYHLLNQINTRKATHSEDFPSWISRNNSHLLAQPISDIINSMLRSGYFPAMWKKLKLLLSTK